MKQGTSPCYVLGLGQEDADRLDSIVAVLSKIAAQKSRATDIQVSRIKQAGVWADEKLNNRWMAILSISKSDFHDEAWEKLADMAGQEYYEFLLFNQMAMDVANAHGLPLPRVLMKINESEIPPGLGTALKTPYPELMSA